MKSGIFHLVNRLWPLAAFLTAACLVVAFIHSQRAVTQEASPEEQRRDTCKVILRTARILAERGQSAAALDEIEKILRDMDDVADPALHLEAAELCLKTAPPLLDRALEHADRFIALCPEDGAVPRAREIRGDVLYEKKKYDEALAAYKAATDGATPGKNNARALGRIGRCYWRLGDDINAERYFDMEISFSVDYRGPSEAHFVMGEIFADRFSRLNRADYGKQALEHYRRVFDDAVNPDLRYAARVRTGDMNVALGKYKDAEAAYLAALDALPPLKDMLLWLRGGENVSKRDDLLRLQVFGRPQTFTIRGSDVVPVPATKMQAVLQQYHNAGDITHEIEDLGLMAAVMDNRQEKYLEIARRYDDLTRTARQEIEALKAELDSLRRGPASRLQEERIFRAEKALKDKTGFLDDCLRSAAEYYERGFDQDPYAGTALQGQEHALWKAAQRRLDRKDYAGAERILIRLTRPELKFDQELLLKSQLILGRMYRELGRSDEALQMFRALKKDQNEPADQLRGDAAYEEAVTLAAIGEEEAAEAVFCALMRDDNPYGVGIYSKIWRDSAFALGRLRYARAVSADTDRENLLNEAVLTLSDAIDRYSSFIDEETRNRSLFFVGDCLHHLALEAMRRGENQKAREQFAKARSCFGRVDAPAETGPRAPLYYRNSRLICADALLFESNIAADPAEKKELLKKAFDEFEALSKSLEGSEQGLWALIQMGRISGERRNNAAARRYFDMAESGIAKLKKENAFADNPGGFDANYLQKVLEWLRDRNNGE